METSERRVISFMLLLLGLTFLALGLQTNQLSYIAEAIKKALEIALSGIS